MALYSGITIDGVLYDVRIRYDTLQRTFTLIEGRNAGTTIAYRRKRDLQGIGYSYTFGVEPNPTNRAAYDTFYAKITENQDSHTITLPFGQTSITFDGYIESGTDTFKGFIGGQKIWSGLTVTFSYIAPYQAPTT